MDKSKDYFPEFDLIRFCSSIMVVYCHVIILKNYIYPSSENQIDFVYQFGKFLMGGFFAQSGFLITHFLLKEMDMNKRISLPIFFVKRIFRIWPLYLTLTFLSLFILPKFSLFYIPEQSEELVTNLTTKSFFLFTFQPQLQYLVFKHPIPGAEQLWSIGVEELFYLIIPLLLTSFLKSRTFLFLVVFTVISIRFLSYYLSGIYTEDNISSLFYNVFLFLYYTRIECLLAGVITAIAINDSNFRTKTYKYFNVKYQIFLVLLVLISFLTYKVIHVWDYFFYSVVFCYIFIYFLQKKDLSVKNNSIPFIKFLGKITYPIYITHYFTIIAIINYSTWQNTFLIFITGISITIVVSTVAYFIIEKPALNLRNLILKAR